MSKVRLRETTLSAQRRTGRAGILEQVCWMAKLSRFLLFQAASINQ